MTTILGIAFILTAGIILAIACSYIFAESFDTDDLAETHKEQQNQINKGEF